MIDEAPVPVQRVSQEGFLYKSNGFLFMFMSGAFSGAELALSVHTWDCEGFVSSAGTPANGYNANEFWADVNQSPAVLVPKKPIPMELDGLTLRGVPDQAVLTIEGKQYTADGTDIELSFSHPGTFTVNVTLFPWLDGSVEVVSEN